MLIGFSGLAGAGKTTAINILEQMGVGVRVYVGALVTNEVARRGMIASPSSEKEVRESLRRDGGKHALARLALPAIKDNLASGRVALVDAIYCEAERSFYEKELGDRLQCIAIKTSFANRSERLAHRTDRPIVRQELEARDTYELDHLRLNEVMAQAQRQLSNDETLCDFQLVLRELVKNLSI